MYHKELDEDCFLCLLTRCCGACNNSFLQCKDAKASWGGVGKKGPTFQETYISHKVPYSAFPEGIFNNSI